MTYDPHPLFEQGLLPDAPPLSAAGQQRRAAMLDQLTAAVRRRRRIRKAARAGGLVATVLAIAWVAMSWIDPARGSAPQQHDSQWRMAHADFEWIRSDLAATDTLVQRWSVPTEPSVVRIDDSDLAEWLRAAGQPSGLLIIDGTATPIALIDNEQPSGE